MRRHLALTSAAILALSLAACGSGGSADGLPEVSGDFSEQPTLTFPDSDPPAELQVEVVSEGDGDEVAEGDYLVANYIGQVWDAESPFNDSFAAGQAAGFSLDMVIEGWKQSLPGTHVGDRVLISIPSELGYPDGNESAGIAAGDTLVFVVDVLGAFGADKFSAQADARDTGELAGLPVSVSGDLGAPASVTITAGAAAPTEVSTTMIAEGSGDAVGETGTVVVSFSATGWDGTAGGSTWDLGAPEAIGVGAGTVFDGLIGLPSGSRVVSLIPESEGTPAIAAVIDIVGYVP